ncbi:cytochrome c-type biogenesis protein CcmF [Selenomonas ruminantium]|uniref:Cytochrome c-type biogenesis protein CcmF n=1 Tax=Selenomonas ruminantium TaxID=971 RepID=A0A1M6XY70_SELRU|nr:cytochrome c biogenesis protein CcsA [Selenomonas ruminantium]SHL10930.1 cytochrome c-type biogenesis protein CcmF [Selenomonas ruminantium]
MVGVISLALTLALSLAAVLSFAAQSERTVRWGRFLTMGAFLTALLASIYLLVLIFQNRFDIAYVASYSSKELTAMYKFSAFWAGQQGSFLLWLLIHGTAGLCLAVKKDLSAAGMAVYMALMALLTVLVMAKSPFVPSENVVENGVGLNPLLQDPWMAVHPPIIFIGYALLAVPLVYSAAALLTGQKGKDWLPAARHWALIGWGFLGAGIFIGGYWAYKVLGWGGFWGWDPVENSSLVPWLVAGIFVHVLRVAQIREAAITMVHLAGIFAYALVLYGTFLTRSGILGDFSVHSFAGTSIGMTIAVVNGVVLLAGLLLLLVRAKSLPQGEYYPAYGSREFIMLLGALLLVFMSAIIFLGMSMPLFTQLIGKPAAVSTDFYVRTTMPLAIAMLLTISCALLRGYGEGKVLAGGMPLVALGLLGAGCGYAAGVRQFLPLLLAAVSLMALGATVISWRRHGINMGGMVAHVGLAISLLAMVLAGSGSQSYSREMVVGESYDVFGHEVTFMGQDFLESGREKYYVYQVDGQEVKALTKLRANGEDAAREPAIAKGLGGDVYLAPTPPQDNGRMEMVLKQGRMSMDEDFAYRFEKARVEKNDEGGMTVTADVAITDGNTVEHADLVLTGTHDGGTAKPVEIFGGQKRLRLTGVTQNQKQIRIESMPSVETESRQPITTSVSVKPCIWLLWLGSILVCAGTLWAAKR